MWTDRAWSGGYREHGDFNVGASFALPALPRLGLGLGIESRFFNSCTRACGLRFRTSDFRPWSFDLELRTKRESPASNPLSELVVVASPCLQNAAGRFPISLDSRSIASEAVHAASDVEARSARASFHRTARSRTFVQHPHHTFTRATALRTGDTRSRHAETVSAAAPELIDAAVTGIASAALPGRPYTRRRRSTRGEAGRIRLARPTTPRHTTRACLLRAREPACPPAPAYADRAATNAAGYAGPRVATW